MMHQRHGERGRLPSFSDVTGPSRHLVGASGRCGCICRLPLMKRRFTMVKYIRAIEFVETYAHIGKGQGGWLEDYQYFSQEAGI
jgi:hypothetical protein